MSMITFHILGAGGAVPTATHSPAAYWVVVDQEPVLMDPGPGALVRLARSGAAPGGVDDIGRVVLTHLHPDHTGDLVALLFALHSPVPVRTDPLLLWGPPGLEAHLEQLRGIYGRWLEPRRRDLVVTEIRPGDVVDLPGGGTIEAFGVNHPQDRLSECALGYRFCDAGGHTAVFSGDTGPSTGLEKAATGVDLLVVECSCPDHLATAGHLTPGQVAALCQKARPARVALTHQYPDAAALDLAALVNEKFDGPVIQATDGLVLDVPES